MTLLLLAQAATTEVDPQTLRGLLLTGVALLLGSALVGLVTMGVLWIGQRTKTTKLGALWYQLAMIAQHVVADMEASMRPTFKNMLSDGKLTTEEAKQIKSLALSNLKTIGAKQFEELKRMLGGTALIDIIGSGLIETSLRALKGAIPVPPLAVVNVAPVVPTLPIAPAGVALGRPPSKP